jgi:hypothetical protein
LAVAAAAWPSIADIVDDRFIILAVTTGTAETLLGIKGLVCIFPLDIAGDVADTGVDAFASDGPYDADETRDGATVVGPEKKLPSSSVSRKSLLKKDNS